MISVTQTEKGKQYDVRLSGSITNLLLVGIIAILKNKTFARTIIGLVGIILLVVGGLSYLAYWEIRRFSPPLLVAGFGMVLAAILSAPSFNLFVGVPVEVDERRKTEEELKDSKDPFASLAIDSKRLSEYYAINQTQARGSFRWAVLAMLCGLATIVAGVWIFYFRETPNAFLTSLATASGIVVDLISGMFLYLHNKTQRRALFYYNQLVRTQQLGLAIRLAETHADEEQSKAKTKIIDEILEMVKLSTAQDLKDAKAETE